MIEYRLNEICSNTYWALQDMLKLDYTDVIVITTYTGTWCMQYKVHIVFIVIDVGVPWNVNKYHKDTIW